MWEKYDEETKSFIWKRVRVVLPESSWLELEISRSSHKLSYLLFALLKAERNTELIVDEFIFVKKQIALSCKRQSYLKNGLNFTFILQTAFTNGLLKLTTHRLLWQDQKNRVNVLLTENNAVYFLTFIFFIGRHNKKCIFLSLPPLMSLCSHSCLSPYQIYSLFFKTHWWLISQSN